MKNVLWGAIGLGVLATATMAAPAIIGTASVRGTMRVDGANVLSNATLFDGSVVETDKATTALHLDKGVEVKLATDSRGTLYRDRLVLQKGSGETMSAGGFVVEANGLHVVPDMPNSRGVVSMKDGGSVEVAALSGGVHVTNSSGFVLASLQPGRILSFTMDATGAIGVSTVTGCLSKFDGAYFLTVSQTGVVYELTGQDLDKLVGRTVTVTGTPDLNAQPKRKAAGVILVSNATAGKGNVSCSATAGGAIAAAGVALGAKLAIGGIMVGAATGTAMAINDIATSGASTGPASVLPPASL